MSMNDHDLHHLAGAYALDALDAEERRAFEAHYPACDICKAEVTDFREIAGILAEGVEMSPRPDLKTQIMAEVSQTRQVSPILPDTVVDLSERRIRKATTPMVLATAAAAIVLIFGLASVLRDTGPSPAEVILATPDAVVTTLEGDQGSLRIVWSAELDQVAIIGSDLPSPGEGMAYALWFVQADGVAPATLFDSDGEMISFVSDVANIDPTAWGVTIEPEEGSPQPTGDILYQGAL